VLEIKNKLKEGNTIKQLAQEYKTTEASIHNIRSGKRWKSII